MRSITTALPEHRVDRLQRAVAGLEPPFAVIDEQALLDNADDLVRRSAGKPVRLVTKSVRVRGIVEQVLARDGFTGVLTYSLREALCLVAHGVDDLVVGYPSLDRGALSQLGADPRAQERIALVVDDAAQLDAIEARVPRTARVRLVIDVDASLRLGPLHLGARRSPVRTPADALRLVDAIQARPWATLAGVMVYDAQIAGQQDVPATRVMKALSRRELAARRVEVVRAVQSGCADPLLVNAGGTGSIADLVDDPVVTEVAAGSGLFAPGLFDGYDAFTATPSAFFVTTVVRRPAPGWATVFGGGYTASGPAGRDRLPRPTWPAGLRLAALEGAGEVQTPVRGPGAAHLAVGDRVWFRHAKAGELCERFDVVHVVTTDGDVIERPTYRGEGWCFG